MINWLHQRLHDPAAGWDPIPGDYAREYARGEWANVDAGLLDGLESEIGSLRGRSVLDLGGGPGQFSVAFARRGARVTWFDVSGNYERIAREHARDEGVEIDFVQGYLEQAVALGVDAYISGEISEHTVHMARETGVHYFSAGHHATERYGVQALGSHLAEKFGLDFQFCEINNQV